MNGNELGQIAQWVATLVMLILALPLLSCAFMAVASAFWIWMIIDCATNDELKGNDKIVWILIVIFAHLLGALIYCFVARPRKTRQPPTPPPLPQTISQKLAEPLGDPDKKYYENYGKK